MNGIVSHHSRRLVASMIAASLLLHGALYAAVVRERRDPPQKNEVAEFEIVRQEPPPPPEEKREPLPEPIKAKVVSIPRPRVASKPLPPPPPNTEPSPTPDAKPPVIKIGISLGSTTTSGGFSVGVGNTLYGKADSVAADPGAVKPYAAPQAKQAPYVPPSRVSTLPRLLEQLKPDYPVEAKKAGIEGQVILMLAIDETGRVTRVKVLGGPGYGLEPVAERTASRFRFAPATVNGEAVATEIRYVYTFVLE